MSDLTEREKVLLRREGFAEAYARSFAVSREGAERRAAQVYPLPKVMRRRVQLVDGYEYRVDGSGKGWQWREPGTVHWATLEQTPATFPVLLDLLDHPDEEVEA